MKVIRFFVVVICAVLLLRLAACTTGLSPAPQEPPTTPSPLPQRQEQQIRPQGGGEVTQPVVDAARARTAALTYVMEHFPEAAAPGDDPLSLQWEQQDLTPAQTVGISVTGFTAGEWQITVRYPVVLPELVKYQVTIENAATGFSWSGTLDANFDILPQ